MTRTSRAASGATLPPLALAYHGVADVALSLDPHGLFVRPRDLERQVRLVRRWGYRLVPFGELLAATVGGGGRGLAALTFDDGFADNLEQLLPVLRAAGAPATVFVVPGFYGRQHPDAPFARCLTRDEVQTLGSALEIGSHTMTHRDLTVLSAAEQSAELRDSRAALEDDLQRNVDLVAYPFGRATRTTVEAAREAGYAGGCRTAGTGSWLDPLQQPRQDMSNASTRLGLELKRRDLYEPVTATLAGRAVRRGSRLLKAHLRPWRSEVDAALRHAIRRP